MSEFATAGRESVSSKVFGPETVWVIGYSKRSDAAGQILSESDQYHQKELIGFDGGLLLIQYKSADNIRAINNKTIHS
jgi:hypothetical protein